MWAQDFYRPTDQTNFQNIAVAFKKRVTIEPRNLGLNFPLWKQANGNLD
jgi:hypothetical protein